MSEWDPWKRFERERERRMWDPWARLEYERERMSWDPYYRMEKELTDPWYRYEKQRERELWDPMFRFEKEQERLREDSWYREQYKLEYGLRIDQVADPLYVQEKESGLGTRPNDYFNPDYRIEMDRVREDIPVRRADIDLDKFFDPKWMSVEEVDRQLKELEEQGKPKLGRVVEKNSSGVLAFLKRLFLFL